MFIRTRVGGDTVTTIGILFELQKVTLSLIWTNVEISTLSPVTEQFIGYVNDPLTQ